ncbi:MAG TPA: VOC family protein [Candidatus Margulisiibacteriota bacterium]|nr:VOC family protein [Candidatus Margulisiibacteriota bacterium]
MEFDSVQIGAEDVAAAMRAYEVLLGILPGRAADGAVRFQLQRGAVEIERGAPGLHSMRFSGDVDIEPAWPADAFHGLRVDIAAAVEAPRSLGVTTDVEAIDHVVIHTPDLERAIALWRDRIGLRLALDREFPKRGLRLVFFRSAGVTLEFAGPLPPAAHRSGPDAFYGIAYRVADLTACRARLRQAGIDVSEQRPGQKSGTLVATVRSGTAGVPTLLIQDPSRAPEATHQV